MTEKQERKTNRIELRIPEWLDLVVDPIIEKHGGQKSNIYTNGALIYEVPENFDEDAFFLSLHQDPGITPENPDPAIFPPKEDLPQGYKRDFVPFYELDDSTLKRFESLVDTFQGEVIKVYEETLDFPSGLKTKNAVVSFNIPIDKRNDLREALGRTFEQ